jgi:hypothetical protein
MLPLPYNNLTAMRLTLAWQLVSEKSGTTNPGNHALVPPFDHQLSPIVDGVPSPC